MRGRAALRLHRRRHGVGRRGQRGTSPTDWRMLAGMADSRRDAFWRAIVPLVARSGSRLGRDDGALRSATPACRAEQEQPTCPSA